MTTQSSHPKLVNIFVLGLIIATLIYLPVNNSVKQQNKIVSNVSGNETIEEIEMLVLWNKTFGGEYNDNGESIIKSDAGKYVISGWTNSSGDLDIFLIGLNSDGEQEWNQTIGDAEEDKGFQIITCDSGGYAIASTFTNITAPYNDTDFMVSRIANDGTIIWNKCFVGPEQTGGTYTGDLGRSIVQCSNGDFVLGGVTYTTSGKSDIWMLRITSNGIKLWDRVYHNWDIDRCFSPHSIVQCNDGGFAVLGYTYNSTDSNDVWLIRTNSNGLPLWNRTYGDATGYQRPESLIECSNEGFAIIANTQSFGAGNADAWVIRTDLFGNQIWNQTYGEIELDQGHQIVEMPDNELTFVGSTHNFDQAGQGDAWIVRIDENGTQLWNYTIGDAYGNSAGSFVYDGSETFTVLGSTHIFGETFSKIWLFRVELNTTIITITPTTPSTSSEAKINYPFFAISSLITIITMILIRKKRR
ncbi:MAG: hypothetical protein ACTSQK_11270 [Candidatus Heimdallarchaeota archaeon]